MPPLSQCLGLVLLVACPAALPAQTVAVNARRAPRAGNAGSGLSGRGRANRWPLPRRSRRPSPIAAAPRSAGPAAAASSLRRRRSGEIRSGLPSPIALAGSLAVVLGLFFALVWVFRRAAPKGSTLLPGEVVEVLGRAPLAGRQSMHLLRCGNKLLLVSVTPGRRGDPHRSHRSRRGRSFGGPVSPGASAKRHGDLPPGASTNSDRDRRTAMPEPLQNSQRPFPRLPPGCLCRLLTCLR